MIDTTKLLTMGMKLGIGASLRYLRKNRSVVSKLAAPGGYDPMDLLAPMARELETLDIAALHVFTFNQVANTVAWQLNVGGGASFLDNEHDRGRHTPWAFRLISRSHKPRPLQPLTDIAAQMGIGPHLIEPYGDNLAKIKLAARSTSSPIDPKAKYVVVSAITPTPARRGQDHHHGRTRPGVQAHRQAESSSPSASRRWGRRSASRAAPPAAATAR